MRCLGRMPIPIANTEPVAPLTDLGLKKQLGPSFYIDVLLSLWIIITKPEIHGFPSTLTMIFLAIFIRSHSRTICSDVYVVMYSMHTCMPAFYLHTYIHACMHAYIHKYIHTYIHTYKLTHMRTYMHSHPCAYTHTSTSLSNNNKPQWNPKRGTF